MIRYLKFSTLNTLCNDLERKSMYFYLTRRFRFINNSHLLRKYQPRFHENFGRLKTSLDTTLHQSIRKIFQSLRIIDLYESIEQKKKKRDDIVKILYKISLV